MAFGVFDSQGMFIDSDYDQRCTLFYTKCLINNKWCSLKIDNGCSSNLVSYELVTKLGLTVYDHPKPYELYGLNLGDCLRVSKQVRIDLSMGSYVDEIIFDIMPLVDCHLLFGRPWIFDRDVIHRGRANEYEFHYGGKIIVLKPMRPKAISDMLANLKPGVEVLESDPKWGESKLEVNKNNGVVEFSEPCYNSDFSLEESLDSYSGRLHNVLFKSRAVFDCMPIGDFDNDITVGHSEEDVMQPIWDEEVSADFSDESCLVINSSGFVGESCDSISGHESLVCGNKLTKATEHVIDRKEKAFGVHTLLVFETGNKNFGSDFLIAFNVLGIDKSLLDSVIVIGNDDIPSDCTKQFSVMPYRDGVKFDRYKRLKLKMINSSFGAVSGVDLVSTCSGLNAGVIVVEPGLSISNCGSCIGELFDFVADWKSLIGGNCLSNSPKNLIDPKGLEYGVHTLIGNELAKAFGTNGDRTELTGHGLPLLLFDDWGNKIPFSDFVNMFNALGIDRSILKKVAICDMSELPRSCIGKFSDVQGRRVIAIKHGALVVLDSKLVLFFVKRLHITCGLFWETLDVRIPCFRVISERKVVILGFAKVDMPEMRSFPFEGGGDDTDLDTTFIGNSLPSEHVCISGILAYYYSLIRVNTWFLKWYECWLINNHLCQSVVVRRIWLVSWSRAYSGWYIENLSYILGVLIRSLLLLVGWLALFVCFTCHLIREYSRLVSVARLKSLASYFTVHMVPGAHNMHWMARNEVRKR